MSACAVHSPAELSGFDCSYDKGALQRPRNKPRAAEVAGIRWLRRGLSETEPGLVVSSSGDWQRGDAKPASKVTSLHAGDDPHPFLSSTGLSYVGCDPRSVKLNSGLENPSGLCRSVPSNVQILVAG